MKNYVCISCIMLFISGMAWKWSVPAARTGCGQIDWKNEVRGQTRVESDLGYLENMWNKSSAVSLELSCVKAEIKLLVYSVITLYWYPV